IQIRRIVVVQLVGGRVQLVGRGDADGEPGQAVGDTLPRRRGASGAEGDAGGEEGPAAGEQVVRPGQGRRRPTAANPALYGQGGSPATSRQEGTRHPAGQGGIDGPLYQAQRDAAGGPPGQFRPALADQGRGR